MFEDLHYVFVDVVAELGGYGDYGKEGFLYWIRIIP